MAQDTQYGPVPLIYKSRGLIARNVEDQIEPGYFIDFLNCLERQENSISSRYGTQIINRDPQGALSPQNYYFAAPVVTLAKMSYGTQANRYAALSDGTLQRRQSNLQGPYQSIYSGLSGSPLQTLSTNCFETSQPFIFIYDSLASIKDSGQPNSTPTLTGLDPSPQTANTLPYSPLLTLVDNFASANTYTTSGTATAFAYSPITTLSAASSQIVTDFPEFLGISNSSGGGGGTYALSGGNLGTAYGTTVNGSGSGSFTSPSYSGFPSVATAVSDTITLNVTLASLIQFTLIFQYSSGTGSIALQVSTDNGATFTTFYTFTGSYPGATLPATVITQPVSGLTNLSNLQVRFIASMSAVASGHGTPFATAEGTISAINATTDFNAATDPFDGVVNGMLANLATGVPPGVAISSVQTVTQLDGLFTQLEITAQTPHGYAPGGLVSVYGSTADLVDGFYSVQATPSATTFLVAYLSPVYLTSQGGITYGGLARPESCVLANRQSTPYPSQVSAWGVGQQVPLTQPNFPIGCFACSVAQNTTADSPAKLGKTVALDLSYNNQVTDDDLIVLTLLVSDPAAVDNIRLQFDVRGSDYEASYYYKDISPAYYQSGVQNLENAYTATEQQILADTLGVITGAPPNSVQAQLQPGNISTGSNAWQTIYLRRGDFVAVGTAGQPGLDWSAITGWQLVVTTTTVGSTTLAVNGIYLQWGYGPSSFAGVGYDYRLTPFNIATGTEGNGTPIQNFNPQFGWLASLSKPIFLRQAALVTGFYYTDTQVSHVRVYRRGGIFNDNWRQIDQVPNLPAAGVFQYKDVVTDIAISQAKLLELDNDPPVTSSLRTPILTTLTSTTTSPGSSIYSQFAAQTVTVADSSANFVYDQEVVVGNPNNLELVRVVMPGMGQFSAVLRLQHNAGEQVSATSLPRVKCNLCALAYGVPYLAGDENNPHYLYLGKAGRPENFSPAAYIPVGSPDYPIRIVVNWRGTLFVATTQTWWLIPAGATARPQPTGSIHGAVSSTAWSQSESAIEFLAADGWRQFVGADGQYMTLPVEFLFTQTPDTPVPLVDPAQMATGVFAFFNNTTFGSYASLNSGKRYRLIFDHRYSRWRYDDIPATAMLWERDTNMLLAGVEIGEVGSGKFAVIQDQLFNQDYDDGGWNSDGTALVKTPVLMTPQTPFSDLGSPHNPKQWNVLESDANTQGQVMTTELLFNTEPPTSLALDSVTTTTRDKIQLKVLEGQGYQAYSASIRHEISVLTAPTLYQEDIYAAVLADYRSSFDTYWIKFNYEYSKIVYQGYFDYTSDSEITIDLYADGNMIRPYFSFVLPPEPNRKVVRQLFSAKKLRLFRMIGNCAGAYQFWSSITVEERPIKEGSTYQQFEVLH